MKELIKYLLDNLVIDFQGEITLETVRSFLREDDGREARQLLAKLIEEKGVDDMLITLADCLKEHIQSGINERTIREQLGDLLGQLSAVLRPPASAPRPAPPRVPPGAGSRPAATPATPRRSRSTCPRSHVTDVLRGDRRSSGGAASVYEPLDRRRRDLGRRRPPRSSIHVRSPARSPVTATRQAVCLQPPPAATSSAPPTARSGVFVEPELRPRPARGHLPPDARATRSARHPLRAHRLLGRRPRRRRLPLVRRRRRWRSRVQVEFERRRHRRHDAALRPAAHRRPLLQRRPTRTCDRHRRPCLRAASSNMLGGLLARRLPRRLPRADATRARPARPPRTSASTGLDDLAGRPPSTTPPTRPQTGENAPAPVQTDSLRFGRAMPILDPSVPGRQLPRSTSSSRAATRRSRPRATPTRRPAEVVRLRTLAGGRHAHAARPPRRGAVLRAGEAEWLSEWLLQGARPRACRAASPRRPDVPRRRLTPPGCARRAWPRRAARRRAGRARWAPSAAWSPSSATPKLAGDGDGLLLEAAGRALDEWRGASRRRTRGRLQRRSRAAMSANSSPPTRATMSSRRMLALTSAASWRSTASPARWPHASLIRLKWSMSKSTQRERPAVAVAARDLALDRRSRRSACCGSG